jgi:membrane-associated phospholipid phosphatase
VILTLLLCVALGPDPLKTSLGDDYPLPDPDSQQQAEAPEFAAPHESFSGFFEGHGSSKAWRAYVWDDYLTKPAVLLPLGLAVAAAAVSPWDKRLEEHWHGLLGGHQTYSNIGVYVLGGAAVLSGALFPGEGRNTWDNLCTEAESFLASSLTVYVLKVSVARQRPHDDGAPGNGNYSFPSSHASVAFTSATLIDRNSGLLYGLPAYGLAGFTAFERVEAGRHYPSDVLAGAAIGALSAGILDSLHWGAGPGRGIARQGADLRVGFVDRCHGVELSLELPF